MTALYVLTNEYLALAEKLADGDFDLATVADTIEASGITDELAVKAQGIEYVARGAEAYNAAIDEEISRLQALKARRVKTAQALRNYLLENMIRAGIRKLEAPMFSLSLRDNPPAVEVLDDKQLPSHFWVTPEPKPPEPRIDKKAIAASIKAGIDVPGARLTQETRLVIA